MKAAILEGAKDIIIKDIPVPEISDDEVLIEVEYCGICGTDLHAFQVPGFFPLGCFLGHELSGVLAAVGSNVEGWKTGDRVTVHPPCQCGICWACRHGMPSCCVRQMESIGVFTDEKLPGGFAEFVRVREPLKYLYALPEKVSFEEGALVEPLAASLHAVRTSAFKPRDFVVVLGAGPIGLGVIAFLKNGGASTIVATETKRKRAEVAKKFGADFVFDPREIVNLLREVMKLTDEVGANVVYECSGVPQAFGSATGFLRPGGQVMLVGIIDREVPTVPAPINMGELQIKGSMAYNDEFPMVIDFLKQGATSVREMATSIIKLDDIVEQGFNKLLEPDHDQIKILVTPK